MRLRRYSLPLFLTLCAAAPQAAQAEWSMQWEASTLATAGSGQFAPTLMSADRAGRIIEPYNLQEEGKIMRPISTDTRFSYGFGADLIFSASSSTSYRRWSAETEQFHFVNLRPAWFRVQQLFGEIKYRGVYLFAGMKENDRSIFNNTLGSGDLTLSNNARPIPQVRVGFIDFQNIPLTNGWVQIQGDIAYGHFCDDGWLKNHFARYNSFITTDTWYHYKRCYFRTKPSKPFSVTVGMQHAAQFGGVWDRYRDGEKFASYHDKVTLKQLLKIFYQGKGNDSDIPGENVNFIGNHLGTWDIRFRYRFRNDATLTAYMQKPWEDESGIAWQTGFDGVYGLEYKSASPAWIDGAVVEYLDFTNQGGPLLWDIRDNPTTAMDPDGKATGADDYYNNFMYNGWANYGQSIGSPIFKAPVYNRDGYLRYIDNHLRGFHVGIQGSVMTVPGLSWRFICAWKQSNGTPHDLRADMKSVTSVSAQAEWKLPSVKGLTISAQLAFDAGSLYQPAFGALASVAYCGDITFKRKQQ